MAPLLRGGSDELLQPHRLYEWLREDRADLLGISFARREPALHPARRRRHLVRPQGDGRRGEIHQQQYDRGHSSCWPAPPSYNTSRVPVGGYPLHGLDVCDADLQYHGLLLAVAVHGAGSRTRLFAPAGKLVPSILAGFAISFVILAIVPLSVFLMLPLSEITEVASLSGGGRSHIRSSTC